MKLGLVTLGAMALVRVRSVVLRTPFPRGRRRMRYYADVGGARLRFVDEGEGPAVVLIHGFASRARDLARRHGRSSRRRTSRARARPQGFRLVRAGPTGDYSPQAEAQLVLALMDQRNIKQRGRRGALVGLVGRAGVALAAPERVTKHRALRRVGLRGAAADHVPVGARRAASARCSSTCSTPSAPTRRSPAPSTIPRSTSPRSSSRRSSAPSTGPERRRPRSRPCAGSASPTCRRATTPSKQPVLLLWGREDEVTLLPFGERLARDLPHAHLRRLPALRALPDDRGGRRLRPTTC